MKIERFHPAAVWPLHLTERTMFTIRLGPLPSIGEHTIKLQCSTALSSQRDVKRPPLYPGSIQSRKF